MDQAETYAGLVAAGDLATALGNSALATRARGDAARMQAGVAALWNTVSLAYDWAVHDNGAHVANQWQVLYSDSLQQAWAVAFGVAETQRSSGLLSSFFAAQPNWALPAATALFDNGTQQQVGYWPVAGLAFRNVGMTTVSANAAGTIRSAAITANRAWPFTTGNAGQLILLESFTIPVWAGVTTTTTVRPTTTTRAATTSTTRPRTTTTTRPATTTTTRTTTTTTSTTTTTTLLPVPLPGGLP
jgi:hypothetical protein